MSFVKVFEIRLSARLVKTLCIRSWMLGELC
jgi:hypothetical protein